MSTCGSRPSNIARADPLLMLAHGGGEEGVRLRREHDVDVRLFEGFDARSRGLFAVKESSGLCLEPEFRRGTTFYCDRLLPARSGDLVALRDECHTQGRCAWIEFIANGRMIAHCNEGPFELDPKRSWILGRVVMSFTPPIGLSVSQFIEQGIRGA